MKKKDVSDSVSCNNFYTTLLIKNLVFINVSSIIQLIITNKRFEVKRFLERRLRLKCNTRNTMANMNSEIP